jgi:hypothetical protein
MYNGSKNNGTSVEGRKEQRRNEPLHSTAIEDSSSSESDFRFQSSDSCSTCSSTDSELDASIYTETSGSCRSCAEAAAWDKFVDKKGNLFYVNANKASNNGGLATSESEKQLVKRDWKKSAGKRLKSFLKKKSDDDNLSRKDLWLHAAKRKCEKNRILEGRPLLEQLFGIVVSSTAESENVLSVAALLPGTAASSNGKLGVGDRLIAVNNEPVTTKDIEDILLACERKKQKKVKLTFVSPDKLENPLGPVFESLTVDNAAASSPNVTRSSRSKARSTWISAWDPYSEFDSVTDATTAQLNGFIATLTLRDNKVGQILYSYPAHLSAWKVPLMQLRGAFLTLSQVSFDVLGSAPQM